MEAAKDLSNSLVEQVVEHKTYCGEQVSSESRLRSGKTADELCFSGERDGVVRFAFDDLLSASLQMCSLLDNALGNRPDS